MEPFIVFIIARLFSFVNRFRTIFQKKLKIYFLLFIISQNPIFSSILRHFSKITSKGLDIISTESNI